LILFTHFLLHSELFALSATKALKRATDKGFVIFPEKACVCSAKREISGACSQLFVKIAFQKFSGKKRLKISR
jgi:hypothetical protein